MNIYFSFELICVEIFTLGSRGLHCVICDRLEWGSCLEEKTCDGEFCFPWRRSGETRRLNENTPVKFAVLLVLGRPKLLCCGHYVICIRRLNSIPWLVWAGKQICELSPGDIHTMAGRGDRKSDNLPAGLCCHYPFPLRAASLICVLPEFKRLLYFASSLITVTSILFKAKSNFILTWLIVLKITVLCVVQLLLIYKFSITVV